MLILVTDSSHTSIYTEMVSVVPRQRTDGMSPDESDEDRMTKAYREIIGAVSSSLVKLRADTPDLMKSFSALSEAATRDGALTRKTKELIALALGVAGHCDACLGFHLKALIKLGATRAEIEEALGVAVYMGGGPSLMYAADALTAFEELSALA